LTFNDFLVNLGPVIGVIMALSLGIVVFFFRKRTAGQAAARDLIMKADPKLALVNTRILRRGLPVFAVVLFAFVAGHFFEIEPGLVALVGAFVMAAVCDVDVNEVIGKVEWETILFFVGLFMLIGTLEVHGVFEYLGERVLALTEHHLMLTALAILWVSAVGSALVDNIPLVIAMIPLIETIVPVFAKDLGIAGMPGAVHMQVEAPLFWALALGACLGGNGTLIGASANVVVSQIARRNDYKLSFMDFTRYGAVFTVFSLLVSTVYVFVRYFYLA
jgi:Na+/H+ antiporter NhaD/arsenite permease-like protein